VEVEAVGDAGRDRQRCRRGGDELDERAESRGLEVLPQVVQADAGVAGDNRQVVGVALVRMDAAQNVLLRAHDVPLGGRDPDVPGVTEELGEDAALVRVRLEETKLDSGGKHRRGLSPHGKPARPWLHSVDPPT
jgi:hypothetical protein